MVISFPSGFLVAGAIVAISWIEEWYNLPLINTHYGNERFVKAFLLVEWVAFTALGYFQWFYIVPRIKNKLHATAWKSKTKS
jgi:hypothetical protein